MIAQYSIKFFNKVQTIIYVAKTQISNFNIPKNSLNIKRSYTNGAPGQKVDIDGIKIHYEKVGQGKHTLFLMPGVLGSTRTDFGPQLDGLDPAKFTMVAWDPPGYGYSRPPKRSFAGNFYFTDADIASKFMKKLGCPRYSVLGWSDGGMTAMILAALDPKAVQHLVIWGSNAFIAPEDTQPLEAIRDISKWSDKMRKPFEAMYGAEFAPLWAQYVDATLNNFKEDGGKICTEVLADIHCPTLVLHGDKDPLVRLEHPLYLQKHIKNCSLHRFPEGKHNIHIRYPTEFNTIVQNFLLK